MVRSDQGICTDTSWKRHDKHAQVWLRAACMLLGAQAWSGSRAASSVSLWVFSRVLISLTLGCSSEQNTGVIRIYDGRGDDKPLVSIEKLHRSPVHLMAVCFLLLNVGSQHSKHFSTATDMIRLSLQMKMDLSSSGNPLNPLSCQRMSLACGHSRVRLIYMSSKRCVCVQ